MFRVGHNTQAIDKFSYDSDRKGYQTQQIGLGKFKRTPILTIIKVLFVFQSSQH